MAQCGTFVHVHILMAPQLTSSHKFKRALSNERGPIVKVLYDSWAQDWDLPDSVLQKPIATQSLHVPQLVY